MNIDYEKMRQILWDFLKQHSDQSVTFLLLPAPTDEEIDDLVADIVTAVGPEEKEIDLSPAAVSESLDMIAYNHIVRTLASGYTLAADEVASLQSLKGILVKRLSRFAWIFAEKKEEKEEAVAGSDQ